VRRLYSTRVRGSWATTDHQAGPACLLALEGCLVDDEVGGDDRHKTKSEHSPRAPGHFKSGYTNISMWPFGETDSVDMLRLQQGRLQTQEILDLLQHQEVST
jgi:hypothetical protein